MSASGMFERQRTVALLMFARREPRGSMLLNRKATGSLTNISYQMPMPIGAPSSLLTAWLRRYSWSRRRSSTSHRPKKWMISAAGPSVHHRKYTPGLGEHADHLAEQEVDAAGALLDDRVQAEKSG